MVGWNACTGDVAISQGENAQRSIAIRIQGENQCLVAALGAARLARAADGKNPYPTSMAPLDQYLMDPKDEIALARTAAPPSIAKDATVMVLGRHGYETAVEGTNGFVSIVDRSWMDQFENSPEFLEP